MPARQHLYRVLRGKPDFLKYHMLKWLSHKSRRTPPPSSHCTLTFQLWDSDSYNMSEPSGQVFKGIINCNGLKSWQDNLCKQRLCLIIPISRIRKSKQIQAKALLSDISKNYFMLRPDEQGLTLFLESNKLSPTPNKKKNKIENKASREKPGTYALDAYLD